MKFLLTGGAGFIGLHLCRYLVNLGIPVTIADNFSRAVKDSDFEEVSKLSLVKLVNADLLSKDAFHSLDSDYTHIVHLAALIGVQHVMKKPFEVLDLNHQMLTRVIEFAKQQKKLQRFVFTSTSEVYAGTLQNFELKFPTPESTPLALTDLTHPRTSYMLSKIVGEALCQQSGLPITIVRPHNFYGPRMGLSHVIPELLKKAVSSPAGLEVFSPEHKRTFCYIGDAVAYITELSLAESAKGKTFNIGVENPEYSMLDLAKLILKVTEKNIPIIKMPETSGSPLRRCPSMELTHQTVNYRAQTGLEAGVRATYDWYQKNVFSGGVSSI